MTSRFTYTMEEPGELMERLAQFEQHMDQLYSLSNSGSFASESSKRTNPTAYTRPKLPANLTSRQQSEPQHGRIFAVRQDVSGTNVPEHSLVSARSEKLGKDIANEQKLIAQLELRSLSKNGHSEYEKCGGTSLPAQASAEDQEVARALMGAENSPNVNRRLLAMLQRRNLSQLTHSSTSQKLDLTDSDQIERLAKRGHSHIITELGVPPRTQSQQPMHRSRDTPDTVRRDASLGTTRTINNFRAQTSVESSSEAHTNRHVLNSNMRSKSQGSKSPLPMNTDVKRSGIPNRLLRSTSQRSHPTPTDSTKLSALLNWQRRKAYDPQLSMNTASSKESPRSPYNSIQEDESPRVSHTKCLQIGRVKENGARESSRRSTTANRRTAPVETADCLAALQTIQAQNHYPPHCSVIPKLFAALPNDRNADDSRKSTFRSQSEATNGHMARTTNGRINGEHRIDVDKKRHSRTASVNPENMSTSTHEPAVTARVTKRETSDLTKKIGRKSNLPSVRSTRAPDNLSKRSTSQTGYRNNGSSQTIQQSTNPSGVPDHWTYIDKDQNYPDIAVESIRYKIEKLTNFIVRLRKRIERDYAEQGTCSPGDDVFGDEAVGATIAGQSTGMHPVVAASLKNLRILEFNAQEIFNLLYPTEVDFWEPERVCLTGDIEDERTYNEERSKLTDILTSRIDQNEENNSINKRIKLPFRTEGEERIPAPAMSTGSTEIRIPTDDGDVI
ncbi:hypothetical protein P879_02568 [Paragonimus westermani]|uniref:Uncharacterized protein n=1 Tax=Paragonimus westermani TaxID=34504 RepID=A0A8T0DMK4_9TREM|nr:hypothetical protein P879_02568 [Paragonimus westermani]